MDQINAQGQAVTIIHFVTDVGGQWRIACMPNMTEFGQTMYHPVYLHTNESRAATCPACKKTAAFRSAQEAVETMVRVNRGK